jgi:hypothetical protein
MDSEIERVNVLLILHKHQFNVKCCYTKCLAYFIVMLSAVILIVL